MTEKPDDPLRLAERVAELERQVASLEARLASPSPSPSTPPPLRRRDLPARSEPPPTRLPAPKYSPREEVDEPWEKEIYKPLPDFRAVLRKIHLWPPEGEGNFEVQVGAWWATRIGALLAVIGVVFFGVYVAHSTPPWARLLQLAAVAFGVTAAGHWLERREAKFGAVVFGSGLALVFFTGFAAYAVPAVKIIGHPLVAVAVQGLAVAAIAAASFWKNRSNLATMAIVFGFVTCFFSFLAQLQDISLVAAYLLAAAAAGLWLTKGWLAPLACSVPAAYAVFGAIVLFGWADGAPPAFSVALAFPVAAFVLFTATDYAGVIRNRSMDTRDRRLLQGINAAGAAGLGLLATSRYFPEFVSGFYFLFAALFAGAALLYYFREREDELAHLWFAAGMGFLALGLIEALDARTRWMALAVQSAVVLFVARRTRLWTAEAVMGALWLGSVGLFLHDTAGAGLFRERGGILSLWGLAAAGYLVLSGTLLSLQARWFRDRPIAFAVEQGGGSESEIRRGRLQLNALYAAVLGVAVCAGAFAGFPAVYLPAGTIAAALLLTAIGVTAGHWLAIAAAVLPFVFGQWSFWASPYPAEPAWEVWLNGGFAIGSALAIAAVTHLAVRNERLAKEFARAALAAAHGFWLVSAQMVLFKVASLETSLLVAATIALALLLLAGTRRVDYLADLVPAPLALALIAAGLARSEGLSNLPASGNVSALWIATVGAFAAVCARDCWKRIENLRTLFPSESVSRTIGALTVTVLGVYLVGRGFDYPVLPAAMGLGGVAVFLLGRWPGWPVAAYSAAAFLLAGHGAFLVSLGLERGDELLWAVVLAGLTLACAVLARDTRFVPQVGFGGGLQWIMAVLATGSLFLLFLTRTGALEPYTTVFWGLSAIAVFVAGLAWRAKPLRVVGLIGLGLCLPRVFLVDIHSTFYRIAAFVVIGIVLLIVGFLYHKFRGRIAEAIGPAVEKGAEERE